MAWQWTRKADTYLGFDSLGRDQELIDCQEIDLQQWIGVILQERKVVIDGMEKLVAQYKAGQPIYGYIRAGSRRKSIVRIANKCITLKHASTKAVAGYGRHLMLQGPSAADPRLFVKYTIIHDTMFGGPVPKITAIGQRDQITTVYLTEFLEFNLGELEYEFDGRKSIKSNFKDQVDFQLLPGYQGPTDYQFAKAVSLTAEQKKAAAMANLLAHTPIDMFGNELAVGDMFAFSRRDELLFCRLVKVTDSGFIVGDDIMTKKQHRLQGETSASATKAGERNPALMKFVKDEVLSVKLMTEKLKN